MKTKSKLHFLLVMMLFLSACGGGSNEGTITEEEVLLTYSVGTMVAGFFATQTAMVTPTPLATNTPPPTNTFLPAPTILNSPLPAPVTWTPAIVYPFLSPTSGVVALTPSVTGTLPTATVNTGALAFGCNNSAFVRDSNYPKGSTVSPGEGFVKTWKVENTGSCDWAYNYTLSIVSDKYFDSSWNRLGRDVRPGEWAEVSVIVDAPKHAGTYTGYWRMADNEGHPFGATLELTIVVP